MEEGDVKVRHPAGDATGRLLHRNGLEIEIFFPDPSRPAIQIASEVDIFFLRARRSELSVPARTLLCYAATGGRTYRFHVHADSEEVLSQLLIQRRSARVRPIADPPLEVLLRAHTSTKVVRGLMHDVSGTGIGVLIPSEGEGLLYASDELVIGFELPPDPLRFHFTCSVRSRRLTGAAITYGLQFEVRGTHDFEHQQQRVYQFVRNQELEQLRRTRPV